MNPTLIPQQKTHRRLNGCGDGYIVPVYIQLVLKLGHTTAKSEPRQLLPKQTMEIVLRKSVRIWYT